MGVRQFYPSQGRPYYRNLKELRVPDEPRGPPQVMQW